MGMVIMKAPRWTHSLKWRIVSSYSLILILGGVSTTFIGIRVTGQALLGQARQQVDHGLAAARTIYRNRLSEPRQCVELLATSGQVRRAIGEGRMEQIAEYITTIRQSRRFDFLSVADASGNVLLRTVESAASGGRVAELTPLKRALEGEAAGGTEIVPFDFLTAEDPSLLKRGRVRLHPDSNGPEEYVESALVLLVAAPVKNETGEVVAILYAGQMLNEGEGEGENRIVDQIRDTLFSGGGNQDAKRGVVTIFQDDVRVTTNLATGTGIHAAGTRVSSAVYQTVIEDGRTWSGRAFVVNDWYIAAYEPIANLAGERIGILGVGLLQRPYTAVRDNVTLAFAAIALLCFALIVIVTYFLTRSLMRPLEDMVAVSREIANGQLDQRVREVTDHSELSVLSSSFNFMLDRIKDMNTQLNQWARTLEQKVEERTEQLERTHTAMDRQQRLASLGQLAAGVAHEINNPLGGILTFASLVQEDLPEDSPLREDVQEIVSQADRCRKIVQELLEFSRQRDARMVSHRLNGIVWRTLKMLEKQAQFQNIKIVRELDPDEPIAVADESQLQQVFMNIILNAADAMGDRGKLVVTTGHDSDKGEVFVRIADNGSGIPADLREAIFDPFFTTKDPGKGTGLGLAVVVRIIEAHGGRLEVDSEVGQGTTFTVILPTSGERLDEAQLSAEPPLT